MLNEIWIDIPGYEGKYQASTFGNIRSLPRSITCVSRSGREFQRHYRGFHLKPGRYCKSGHVSVVLGKGKHGSPVHQLVARTFLGKCPEGMEVLHTNGVPTDNRVENLRYGTRSENIIDVGRQGKAWRRLLPSEVIEIREALAHGETGASLAKRKGVCQSTISAIKTRRNFSWLP